MNLVNLLSEYKEYSGFCAAIKKGEVPISVAGICESAMAHFVAETAKEKKALVITYSDMEAKQLWEDLCLYTDDASYFPSCEYIFFDIDAKDRHKEHRRLSALSKGKGICVASLEAVLQFTLPAEFMKNNILEIAMDSEFDLEELCEKLVRMGYVREEEVSGKGQFSLRGGILDVFSVNSENPVRIEFFDTFVDSIREFDKDTQRSIENIDKTVIIPASELANLDSKALSKKLEEEKKRIKRKKADYSKLIENIDRDIEAMENGREISYKYIDLIYDEIPTILDYYDKDSIVFLIEPKRINERSKSFEWEQGEILQSLSEKNLLIPARGKLWKSYADAADKIQSLPLVSVNSLTHSTVNYSYKAIFNFNTKTTVSLHGKVEYLYEDLLEKQKSGATVVVLASNRSRGENLAGTLSEKGINCRYIHDDAEFKKGEIVIVRGEQSKGFEYPDLNFTMISDREIFDAGKRKSR
ncbi:MAG: hypothetical protein E7417_01110, partial [Ruminococcaceae bacterium]|nr:hypothetical protein [Oscillospiraceae bacterium]